MPCPICTGTMANLGIDSAGRRTFRCGSCGTLKYERTGIPDEVDVPALTKAVTTIGQTATAIDAAVREYRLRRLKAMEAAIKGEAG